MKRRKKHYSAKERKRNYLVSFFLFFYFLSATTIGCKYFSLLEKNIKIKTPPTFGPYSDALASNFKKSKKS